MTNERKEELELLCSRFRNQLIDLLHSIQAVPCPVRNC